MARILALDWGKVRVGVAISDPMGMFASPYDTFQAKPHDRLLERIKAVIEEEQVEKVIVGLPYNMDGSEGSSAESAKAFADEVRNLGAIVEHHDERLTSYEAEKKLREAGRKPSRDKGRVDRAAAALLLQDYLDSRQV